MKLYAIIEVNDDYYDDYEEWYIRGDDLEIRYVEDNAYRYYKPIANDMLKLKPLPQKKEIDENYKMAQWNDDCDMAYNCGYNTCLEDILGEKENG